MISFIHFLAEEATEEKLKHLEHAEDHPINAGAAGFTHSLNTLYGIHNALTGHKKSKVTMSSKWDGSPSVVFGHNPENNRFFVTTKSAFNKNPKINYSEEDIERNHGHAPGLVSKLKHALTHLPKVTPPHGVFQGDLMYAKDDNDVSETDKEYRFKPNTITYSTKKDSKEGAKVKNSKLGIVVHTKYEGNSFNDLKAKYNADTSDFASHNDVHLISPRVDTKQVNYDEASRGAFKKHMSAALQLHQKMKDYSHLNGVQDHIKTYINSTVVSGDQPSFEGFTKHVESRLSKHVSSFKTPAKREEALNTVREIGSRLHSNSQRFNDTFRIHNHLQQAKNVLVRTLSSTHGDYGHSIGNQPSKPEGHVAVINNRPTKLVDRSEFSRNNFLKGAMHK
jgi:hypothetical protein